MAFKSQVTITRPANITAYTAGDVVGGVIQFPDIGFKDQIVLLTSCDLRIGVSAIPSGMTSFRLYLYHSTPPSAIADNGAFDMPAGDQAVYAGYVDLGSPALVGGTSKIAFTQVDGVNKQIGVAAGTSLYGYLVTNGGFTPAANSEVYIATLRSVGL